MAQPPVTNHHSTDGFIVNRARSKKHEATTTLLKWILVNQISVALTLICGIISLHILSPVTGIHTRKLFQLSYPSERNGEYRQGQDDVYFVFGWVINFTALRAISIKWILLPLARLLKVAKKSHLRFAEQGWLALYYGTFWTVGMYFWYNSVYWLDNARIWSAWPVREISGSFKYYYLLQFAFWIQQIVVIHIEARRKDHVQMITHHILTCIMMLTSYVFRFTQGANVVLCLMDVVDLVFAIAKLFRYLGYETACNIAFAIFVVTWVITRHIMYLKLCYDIYTDIPGTLVYGCYNSTTSELIPDMPAQPDYFSHLLWPFQDVNGVICANSELKYIILSMLLLLQTLSLIWFFMILKLIGGILTGGKVDDTRSDDEAGSDGGEEEQEVEKKTRPVNVTDLSVCVGGGDEVPEMSKGTTGMSRMESTKGLRLRNDGLIDVEKK